MEEQQDEWSVTMEWQIGQVRALYGVIDYALQSWPGSPARPYEEQMFLMEMKSYLFAMIAEYQYTK